MRTFASRIRAQVDPIIAKLGKDIGDTIERKIDEGIKEGVAEGFAGSGTLASQAGRKSGDQFGGSFSRTAKARIEAALKALPAANIRIDSREAELEIRYLKEELKTLLGSEIGVDVSATEAIAKIDDIKARLDVLAAESPNVQVRVDTLAASVQLAAFRAELEAATSGGGVGNVGGGIAGELGAATSATGPLIAGIAAVGLALVPVVASAAGLAAALVLPLAAAGGGLGLGAILAGFAVKNLEKTNKQIDQLKKKADTLKDPKAKAEALAQADALEKSLSGPQKAFLAAQGRLGKAFTKLQTGKVGTALFAPLVSGMNLLAKVLPALAPVIEAVSKSLVGLLDGLARSASGKGFTSFVDGFARLAGATITSGAKTAALFIQGLFNIFKDFLPLSGSVGDGFEKLGAKFLAFSQKASTKQGIQSFIEYVKANGPTALAFVGNLIKTIVRVGIALAPVSIAMLKFITATLRAFNSIPIDKLRTGAVAVFTTIFPYITGLIVLLKKIGVTWSGVGRVFRSIYNATIGPVMSLIVKAIAIVLRVTGKMLSLLGKAPGFGWAKRLGADLKSAAGDADGLADSIRKIPKSHKTTVTITTVHKGGRELTGGGNTAKVTAIGGVFHGAQQRVIAEAGPEAVVPLNRPLSQVDPSVRWLSAIAQGLTDTRAVSARVPATAAAAPNIADNPYTRLHPADINAIGQVILEGAGAVSGNVYANQSAFAGTLSRQP